MYIYIYMNINIYIYTYLENGIFPRIFFPFPWGPVGPVKPVGLVELDWKTLQTYSRPWYVLGGRNS